MSSVPSAIKELATNRILKRSVLIFATCFAVASLGLMLKAEVPQVASGTWVSAGEIGTVPSGVASAPLQDGRVLAAGGTTSGGLLVADVTIYDAANGWFVGAGQMLEARSGHTVTPLPDGRLLIAGGTTASGPSSTLEIYDPSTGTSTAVGAMSVARVNHAAATLKDGRVLIVGGSDGNAPMAIGEIFDPANSSVSPVLGLMSTPRSRLSATTLLNGKVLIAGGNDGTNDLASLEIYDADAQTFSLSVASLSSPRSGHLATLLPHNANVLIAGGTVAGAAVATAELYVSWTDSISATNTMLAARSGAIGGGLQTHDLAVVVGGGSTTAEFFGFATVKTDKDDYAPGSTALISGAGFADGEVVTWEVDHADGTAEGGAGHDAQQATALADGTFTAEWYVNPDDSLGSTLQLTATGLTSGRTAAMTFTDSVTSVTITSPTSPQTFTTLPAPLTVSFSYVTSTTGGTQATADILGSGASNTKSITPGTGSDSIVVTIPTGTPNGTYNLKVTVTNSTGTGANNKNNQVNGAVIINVSTNTAPTLNLPSAISAEATSPSGTAVTYTATATDAEDDPDPTPSCVPASGSTFALGTTIVNCSVTDSGSLSANGSFTVTVVDTTAPLIAAHADVTAEATTAAGAVVNYTSPSTSDAVDGAGTATCVPASGGTFALGNTTVTCNATDAHSNAAIATSFVVHVVDTTPPVIAAHGDVTAEATSAAGAAVSYTSPATSDAVDGAGTATCVPASGGTFALGNTTVTCNATDAHSNAAIATSFVVHVVDTTPPVIAAHGDATAEATSAAGAVVSYTSPATSDAVDGAGTATCVPASGGTFALGNTTVTCNATDAHSNAAIATSFVVHVVDTTPPVIAAHGDVTAEATSAAGAAVSYTSPATSDAVDGAGTATCVPASGGTFALGNTTVTCNATDAHSNAAIATSFVVHVVDTTPPVIAAHGDATAEATSAAGAVVSYTSPATSDAVDGAGTATCVPASGGTFALGNTTVTCNATDAHSNAAVPTSFVVHVVDTTPPTIDSHANITVVATSAAGAVVNYTAPATHDAVDGSGTASCSPASGSTFPIGTTTVTCSKTDAHGNVGTPTTFTVSVVYSTGPCLGEAGHSVLQPINAAAPYSLFKKGSTVPTKFRVCDANGNSIGTPGLVTGYGLIGTSPGTTIAVDENVYSTTPDTAFRWDPTAQQWIFNQSTKGNASLNQVGVMYYFVINLNDGSQIFFSYQLK